MFGWRAEERPEHVLRGSRGSANEIINASRRRKHQTRGTEPAESGRQLLAGGNQSAPRQSGLNEAGLGLQGNFRGGEASLWAVSSASIAGGGRGGGGVAEFRGIRFHAATPAEAGRSLVGWSGIVQSGAMPSAGSSWDPCAATASRRRAGLLQRHWEIPLITPATSKRKKTRLWRGEALALAGLNDGE